MSRKIVRTVIEGLGYSIYRRTTASDPALQLCKSLQTFDIDTVVDVGANTGQFARMLRKSGYHGRILSVEPLSSVHEKLVAVAARDSGWDVTEPCAVGDHDGEIEINISQNSVSSSVLPMKEAHVLAEASSAYISVETVKLRTLDTLLPSYLDEENRLFLKIDAQGYEWPILDGAEVVLRRTRGILCEVSLIELYDGQKLWLDVLERLGQIGFTLWSINRGFTNPSTGRVLQVDATLYRV